MKRVILFALAAFVIYILGRSMYKKENPLNAVINTASDVAQFATRGLRNNNPGNIRISDNAWRGKVPLAQNTDGAFEQFKTPEEGLRALDVLLRNYHAKGFNTIEGIVTRFAPSTENDTESYIRAVESRTGVNRRAVYPLDRQARVALVRAIVKHENKIDPYTDALMARAIV